MKGEVKMKPAVGVFPLWDDEKESFWMLPGYFDGIRQAGGLPVMLPLTEDPEEIGQYVEMCDGFLFPGGYDVTPEIYGDVIRADNVKCCKRRDQMEKKVFEMAADRGKSMLGICRGIQFFNAVLGGTLY